MAAARNEARYVHRAEHLRAGKGRDGGAEDVVLRRFGLRVPGRSGRRFRLGSRCALPGRLRSGCLGLGGGLLFDAGRGLLGRRLLCGRLRCGSALRSLLRGRLCRRAFSLGGVGLGLGRRSLNRCGCGLRFGVQVDFAEELGLGNLVLHADDVALDDHLLLLFALFLLGRLQRYGGLLHRNAFADAFTGVAGIAVGPELLFQYGIGLRVDQRVGRPVVFDALLLQEVRDGVESHLELLCNLNEP